MVFMGASKSDDVLGDTVGCGMLKCHARSPEADAAIAQLNCETVHVKSSLRGNV